MIICRFGLENIIQNQIFISNNISTLDVHFVLCFENISKVQKDKYSLRKANVYIHKQTINLKIG